MTKALIGIAAALALIVCFQTWRLGSAQEENAQMEIATKTAQEKAERLQQETETLNTIHLTLQQSAADRDAMLEEQAAYTRRILRNVQKSECFTDTTAVPAEYARVLLEQDSPRDRGDTEARHNAGGTEANP